MTSDNHPFTQSLRRRALLVLLGLLLASRATVAASARADDLVRQMQVEADKLDYAAWGHWGFDPQRYAAWSTHSNRLIPVYTFGITLERVSGEHSPYRDAERLKQLYGQVPTDTLNPTAPYFDQTDIYLLQKQAVEAGKKYIILMIFDGLDWPMTQAAAIYYSGKVAYREGRGTGLAIQDYSGTTTDFGWFVSSPYCSGAKTDVNAQLVMETDSKKRGGYDPKLGGDVPWAREAKLQYLAAGDRAQPHAYTDSASSATSLCSGIKSYNGAINVDPAGGQVVPIARQLQQQGFAVGLVTCTPVSHATPAAAYANNVSRGDYQDIARDLVGLPSVAHRKEALRGVDVLLGAGWGINKERDPGQGDNFIPGNTYIDQASLDAIDVAHGGAYRVVTRQAGCAGKDALAKAAHQAVEHKQRLFGLFGVAPGNLPFRTADGDYNVVVGTYEGTRKAFNPAKAYTEADVSENATLADMTEAALKVLSQHERFWMMLEAGSVDWAAHGNNIDNLIGAIKSGDEAFAALVRWIEAHHAWEQTAVIVTADHGHLFVLEQPEALLGPKAGSR